MAANLIRLDPFEDLARIQREVNRLFEDSSRNPRTTEPVSARTWAPPVDVYEDHDEIVVSAELPGVKQDDIDIEITGETLTVRGERKFEDQKRKENYVRVERSYGAFQRSFTIGVPIDADKVEASFHDGVLSVKLPKSAATKPKKVTVSAS